MDALAMNSVATSENIVLQSRDSMLFSTMHQPLSSSHLNPDELIEADKTNLKYKTTKINNRRYLGNKYRLLPFIKNVVDSECKDIEIIADIFAGTGAVSSAFLDKRLITNDIMYSNYICHEAWFGTESFSLEKIQWIIAGYNNFDGYEDNYMTENFSDTYFSKFDCSKIGCIRQNIEDITSSGVINHRERALLITSLLYAMDKIANTCGHYDAYRQGGCFERQLELSVPEPKSDLNKANNCYNEDANELVKKIKADLVYIDPPYNSRQYCDAYHLLENVAAWQKPEVFGVAKKMDRSLLKSDYCTKEASVAFEELIANIDAKYILLSYNNMAEKGNDRSNAKISDKDILRILNKKGEVKVFSEDYKAFTTGKSDIKENEERLFLCICDNQLKEKIKSPLNYTGGKFKLLPQILPLFPKKIDYAIDLFCGGGNVGINLDCKKVLLNDNNKQLIDLFKSFQNTDNSKIFDSIFSLIDKYELSRTDLRGYAFYGCNSGDGLVSYNKERFLQLRSDFNNSTESNADYYQMLYLLIVYAFNNQIRFNSKGDYNLPVGKRDFNAKLQDKLQTFLERMKNSEWEFRCGDFRSIDINDIPKNTFVYADPPYLITCASYNEKSGWTENDEKDLLDFLDNLDARDIKFALSNVLESKSVENVILKQWIDKNSNKYRAISLAMSYANSNYHRKDRESGSNEVLVVNY